MGPETMNVQPGWGPAEIYWTGPNNVHSDNFSLKKTTPPRYV
jgi:hypothetical protein